MNAEINCAKRERIKTPPESTLAAEGGTEMIYLYRGGEVEECSTTKMFDLGHPRPAQHNMCAKEERTVGLLLLSERPETAAQDADECR
jgi:hypothetical protein